MARFKIRALQCHRLYYFIEANSKEEALAFMKDNVNYYQKALPEQLISITKTEMTKDDFHARMEKKGYY